MAPLPESAPLAEGVHSDGFVPLYARWHLEILRFVLTLVPDRHQAEDIVQETARVLWQKFDTYDTERPFWPWARQIAHFEVLKHRKRHGSTRQVFSDELVELLARERSEQEGILEARRQALQHCLKALPEDDRRLLAQRYGDNLGIEEIARERRKTVNALSLVLHRLRQKLAQCVRQSLRSEGWA